VSEFTHNTIKHKVTMHHATVVQWLAISYY